MNWRKSELYEFSRLNLSTIAIIFNDCRLGVSFLATATAAAYEYRAGSEFPLYALKRRKAQKQRSFRAKSTYGHCIKDDALIDKPNSRNQRYRRKQLDRWETKISDQDTDQVNGILDLDLDHKPIEQRRRGRDDGFPPARRMIGRKACGHISANREHL